MADEPVLPAQGEEISSRGAANLLGRIERPKPAASPEENKPDTKISPPSPAPQAQEPEPAVEEAEPESPDPNGDGALDEEPVRADDTTEDDPGEKLPPIAPPRSWIKEHKAAFDALPREIQEKVSQNEQAREADFLRRQNEAVQARQQAEAVRQAAEIERQRYASAIPQVLDTIQNRIIEQFPDIKSWDDVQMMAATDPVRYSSWDAAIKTHQALQANLQKAQEQSRQEYQARVNSFIEENDKAFSEKYPEFSDPVKAPQLYAQVRSTLTASGITEPEIRELWVNNAPIMIHDYRVQELLWKASKYDEAQAKIKLAKSSPAKPPTPLVQRPGTVVPKGEGVTARLKNLEAQFNKTGKDRDAVQLLKARRNARS